MLLETQNQTDTFGKKALKCVQLKYLFFINMIGSKATTYSFSITYIDWTAVKSDVHNIFLTFLRMMTGLSPFMDLSEPLLGHLG